MVWFINDVQLRGFPYGLPNVPSLFVLPWKKSNLLFIRARMKVMVQSLCSVLKDGPVQHPVSVLACVFSCSPLLCFGIQPPSWRPWREQVDAPCECGSHKGESLFPWDYISLGLGWTRCPFKRTNQLASLPHALDGFTPLGSLTSLYDLAPPSVPPSNPVPEVGREESSFPLLPFSISR